MTDRQLLQAIKQEFGYLFNSHELTVLKGYYTLVSQHNHELSKTNLTKIEQMIKKAKTRNALPFNNGLFE